MTQMSRLSLLLAASLALVLTVHIVISYPLSLAGELAAGTILLAVSVAVARWFFARRQTSDPPSVISAFVSPMVIFLLVFSMAVTIQAILAQEVYVLAQPLRTTPGYGLFVRLLHCLFVVVLIWLGPGRSKQVGLGAAIMYTSTFYIPTFFTLEAGPPLVPLRALALVLVAAALPSPSGRSSLKSLPGRLFAALRGMWGAGLSVAPAALLILFAAFAVLFSHSRDDSLEWFLNLLTLFAFIWLTPRTIHTAAGWKRTALLIITFSVAIPTALSAVKLTLLAAQLGPWTALRYRLVLIDLGSHNLIARSLVGGMPLLIASAIVVAPRALRVVCWALVLLAALIFVSCQSWSGGLAVAFAVVFVAPLRYGREWVARWRTRSSDVTWYLSHFVLVVLVVSGLLLILQLAPQARITSFNGRLFRFEAAFRAMLDHPLLGIGPGHYFLLSSYFSKLDWLVDTQTTLDRPLLSVAILARVLPLHTHNLLLEIGLGIGLLGLGAFLWFLADLFRLGVRTYARLQGQGRILVAACLAGIVAVLGWAMLDVMVAFSPFFTFPTWALIGLLLAAPRVFSPDNGDRHSGLRVADGAARASGGDSQSARGRGAGHLDTWHRTGQILRLALLCLLAFVIVVVPLIANLHYRASYVTYQEHRWVTAAEELAGASNWEPLSDKYPQLLGQTLINLGRYDESIAAYEHAARLRRDFAPYHAQLGWLYWLQGDLEEATAHFQKAVEIDPREAWRDGLHADLGLAYAAQGRLDEAIPLLMETIELDPQMAVAPYWLPVQRSGGAFDLVLDPVYLDGPSTELEKRILVHLGRADYTPRLFAVGAGVDSPLSFHQVLNAIEAEYVAARVSGNRAAPRLLATVAEAAQLVGLHDRAEDAYLAFQVDFPESAYGFRDLGMLYREEGHLQDAQRMLEQAVEVSPRDAASWLALAEIYLDSSMTTDAEEALDTAFRLKPLDARLYELRAQLHHQKGDVAQAAESLRRALVIEESIPNRLALAGVHRQLGQIQEATRQCSEAAYSLIASWPRPLNPRLWDIGLCLAQSPGELPKEVASLAREHPLIGNVLLGHVHRTRGEFNQALDAYQAAAKAHPGEAAPHYFLGETYQAWGQPAVADAAYHRAAQLDPLESLPLLALGRLQWGQGQQEAALETFRAAEQATPGWGPAHVALGNALLALGNREGAGEHYQLAQLADHDLQEGLVHDLAAQMTDAEVEAPHAGYVKNDYFPLDGDERRVLFMHPESRARYAVEVPQGSSLAFDLATSPESWEQPGDGVTFSVYVESEDGVEQVFSTYIDPKQNEADRRWHPHTVDLSDYAGQEILLVLETTSGPAGDERFDWAGWGWPRLVAPQASELIRRR